MFSENLLDFDISVDQLLEKVDNDLKIMKEKVESISKQKNPTFRNTVMLFAECDTILLRNGWYFTLMKDTSPSEDIRKSSFNSLMNMVKFKVELISRRNLYEIFKLVKKNEYEDLSMVDRKYLDDIILDFERNGANLSKEEALKFQKIKNQISTNELKFSENLKNSSFKTLSFTADELEGCSSKFLNSLKKNEEEKNKYLIPMQRTIVIEALSYCTNPDTRRKIYEFNESKCEEDNTRLLEDTLLLRQKMIDVLCGDDENAEKIYKNYPEYALNGRMVSNPEKLNHFLNECSEKMSSHFEKVLEEIRSMKKQQQQQQQDNNNKVFNELEMSDLYYYERIIREKKYDLDEQEVKSYLPIFETSERVIQVFASLFGLKIERVDQPPKNKVWHEDVLFYQVYDLETNDLISMFYLDLFPREGKFQHFALLQIQQGYTTTTRTTTVDKEEEEEKEEVVTVIPIGAMLSNYNRPADGSTPLFSIKGLQTFCHEFGHLMHICCGGGKNVKYARYSGYLTVFDFLEVPSSVLEEFAYEVDFLRAISYYSDDDDDDDDENENERKKGSQLPLEICQKIAKSRKSGMTFRWYYRVLRLAKFDIIAHTFHSPEQEEEEGEEEEEDKKKKKKKELQELWVENNFEFSRIKQNAELYGATSFPHIMASLGELRYAVGYYCYIWSKVIASDIFRKFRENVDNYDVYVEGKEEEGKKKIYKSILECKEIGMDMRNKILSFGGQKHPDELLQDFLGRKFNMKAFLNSFL